MGAGTLRHHGLLATSPSWRRFHWRAPMGKVVDLAQYRQRKSVPHWLLLSFWWAPWLWIVGGRR